MLSPALLPFSSTTEAAQDSNDADCQQSYLHAHPRSDCSSWMCSALPVCTISTMWLCSTRARPLDWTNDSGVRGKSKRTCSETLCLVAMLTGVMLADHCSAVSVSGMFIMCQTFTSAASKAVTRHKLAGLQVEAFFRHRGGHQTVELPILEAVQGGILDLQDVCRQISSIQVRLLSKLLSELEGRSVGRSSHVKRCS